MNTSGIPTTNPPAILLVGAESWLKNIEIRERLPKFMEALAGEYFKRIPWIVDAKIDAYFKSPSSEVENGLL
jgi:hypothetical protein